MRIGVMQLAGKTAVANGRHADSLLSMLVRLRCEHPIRFYDTNENHETLPTEAEVRLVRAVEPTATAASSNGH